MTASHDQWKKLEELFEAASVLPSEEQSTFVERETAEDPQLRRELAGMLAHAPQAAERIAQAIGRAARRTGAADGWIGRRFGAYRVVRQIGRGGMGIVFEAVRDDDEYKKRVALKVAPEWRELGLLRERFRHERQILAQLEHPNISRFLDGGTEDGVPYFAMEYVDGKPITEYSSNRAQRQLIELFLKVCAAVDYAHQNLVVHRNLKPSNILVTEDGDPKLLDFGIAKLVSPEENAKTAGTAVMLWTPDYASPEQVRNAPITTRTDVYSLGLILYEMLTGHHAQQADTSSPLALDRSVCETEPPPTSLDHDLESIVRKAVWKEPERRYASVAALSEDLVRYLDGRPVQARPATWTYRALKFIRRRRVVVAAAALVIVSVTAGGIGVLYQAQRAERRFNQVRKLANAFVFDTYDRIRDLPGSTEARKAIVETGLTYLESLRTEAGSDASLLMELASAYERIGDAQGRPTSSNLGDTAGAIQSYSRAEALLAPLATAKQTQAQKQLASVYLKIALVRSAKGDAKSAMESFSRGRAIGESLLEKLPQDHDALDLAGEIYAGITRTATGLGDVASAEEAAQLALGVAQKMLTLNPSDPDNRGDLSVALSGLGRVRIAAGKLEEAAENFREAVRIREQLVQEQPNHSVHRRNLLVGYGQLGDVLGFQTGANLGDVAGAADAFHKALEIAQWLSRADPADRTSRFDVSSTELRLGTLLTETDLNLALTTFQEAEKINTGLLAEDSQNGRYRYNAAYLDLKIGEIFSALERKQEAERRWQKAASTASQLARGAQAQQARYLTVQANLSIARHHAETRDALALELANSVAEETAKPPAFLTSKWNEAVVRRDLGRIYLQMGRANEAATALGKSLQLWQEWRAPAALESRRRSEIAAVQAELTTLRSAR